MAQWLNAMSLKYNSRTFRGFLTRETPCLKKQPCQVGHPAVKCSEPGAVGRTSYLRSPLSHYKNDWYSTSCTLNIMCKDSLKNSKLRQESSRVDWWPCVTPVYGLWPLETSKWTKPNITASFAQWSKDAGLRNQTVLSKNKILSSKKNLSDFQHFWQLPYSMHAKASLMNADKASGMFLWH